MSVAVITGANAGIGLNFTRKLLAKGSYSTVIITGRSQTRCDETATELRKCVAPSSPVDVDAIVCDLDSLASVAQFCDAVKRRVSKIDLLVLNAGFLSGPALEMTAKKSKDGLEQTFAANHLAHWCMQESLLPLLKAAGNARVVITASESHRTPTVPHGGHTVDAWTQIACETGRGTCMGAYGDSKLANVLHASEIQRRYGSFGITANSLHPGMIRDTNIWQPQAGVSLFLIDYLLMPVGWLLGGRRSVDQGGDNLMMCVEEKQGGKYANCETFEKPSAIARDEKAAQALWEASEALCKKYGPPFPSAPQ